MYLWETSLIPFIFRWKALGICFSTVVAVVVAMELWGGKLGFGIVAVSVGLRVAVGFGHSFAEFAVGVCCRKVFGPGFGVVLVLLPIALTLLVGGGILEWCF